MPKQTTPAVRLCGECARTYLRSPSGGNSKSRGSRIYGRMPTPDAVNHHWDRRASPCGGCMPARLRNSRFNRQERQAVNKGQPLRAALRYVSGQLVEYGRAGDQLVSLRGVCPPLPRPLPSCYDIGSGAPFHIEAGDRGLNVDAWLGHRHTVPNFAAKGQSERDFRTVEVMIFVPLSMNRRRSPERSACPTVAPT